MFAIQTSLVAGPPPMTPVARTDLPEPKEQRTAHSPGRERLRTRLVNLNRVATLEVDGAPFLLVGAQCDIWRSTRQDEKTIAFFDGYKAMNATAVSVGVPWSKLEPSQDDYDFRFLDWFIEQAQRRGLKLVVNLFNSNICGKVQEGPSPNPFPQYTPNYILSAPGSYQRMGLPGPWKYDPGGPPMCPNDPRTLERERRLCVAVAKHLEQTDVQGTVILLQLDNEFYYQQWAGARPPEELSVRCQCPFCKEKWKSGSWQDGEEFMFRSFARYARALTDAISAIHPLPLYVNSPWWPPRVIPFFLDECPNLALVGVDGVFSPNEPNMLSRSQVGRNIPFAAENPTENPQTRLNLDVLPYYSIIGQLGLGNLLWECGPPHTVVEDAQARRRYGAALYPIRWAQLPIAKARGTENLVGWYALRDVATEVTTDVFGNFVPAKPEGNILRTNRWYIREGRATRVEDKEEFTLALGDLKFRPRGATAGIIVRLDPDRAVLAMPNGSIDVEGPRLLQAVRGHFDGEEWKPEEVLSAERKSSLTRLDATEPAVILLTAGAPSSQTTEERDLGRFFDGYNGCFVLLDATRNHWLRYHPDLCKTRQSPCSTFKIPNSLITLETGVATGPEFNLPWDGTKHPIEAWNQDQTLRTAFSVSCVWFYQELARRVGNQRMDHWVKAIQYGNQDISGGLTNFWLSNSLALSPDEQLDFLQRLHTRNLPLSARSIDTVLDIMIVSKEAGLTYRGKTGTAGNDQKLVATAGWWVGSVSGPQGNYYFATWITGGENPSGRTARQITERMLNDLNLLPAQK